MWSTKCLTSSTVLKALTLTVTRCFYALQRKLISEILRLIGARSEPVPNGAGTFDAYNYPRALLNERYVQTTPATLSAISESDISLVCLP